MKKKLIYTCTLFCCLLFLMGCADDLVSGIFRGDGVQLTINLNVPGESSAATRAIKTRVGGTNEWDDHLDDQTAFQRYIADNDLYILVFENTSTSSTENWTLLAVPTITNISGEQGDETRVLTAMMSRVSGSKELLVDVVANIVENGAMNGSTSIDFNTMIGQSRETIYNAIGTFAYPENDTDNPYGVWSLGSFDESGQATGEHRYLPMWGQSSTATTGGRMTYTVDGNTTELEVHCGLYRSVAKMGLLVDEGCDTFQPTELYVYYINNEGTFVSLPDEDTNWSPSISVQYTLPEVPTTTTNSQREIQYPLVYKFSALQAGGSYLNNIYVTEADNISGSQPVCLVVGGYYTGGLYGGEGLVDGSSTTDQYTLNYYRIDLESLTTSEGSTAATGPFDVIRNHSYLFNIKNANNPGTSDPDPRSAASGLEVEILDYTEVPMHGINTQYTLTVNKSLFAFEGATTSVGELLVSTDGGVEWQIVESWEDMTDPNGKTVEGGTIPDWVTVYDPNPKDHTNSNDTVYIAVDANVNNENLRNGSFWIKANDVIKKIDIVQDYLETANSYIVTEEGTYDMKVNIRGNGRTYAWDGDAITDTLGIDFGLTDSIPDVDYINIIWETSEGLVTIPLEQELSESGCLSYSVHNVEDEWGESVFAAGHGGNALIGAFDKGNNLLWTFHIWVCGDYASGEKTESWLVGQTQHNITFMDRNLGAYSNLPGTEPSRAFGLLYQWGRKDPFIGAKRDANTTTNRAEQDYHRVEKQRTYHYQQKNGRTYVWDEYNDSEITGGTDSDIESADVKYTISNPTTLLEDGLLSADHTDKSAHGLWGTTSTNYDSSDNGTKTMYDPCPPGYRVPSLDALTIYDGEHNMWSSGVHASLTLRYVPVTSTSTSFGTSGQYTADFVSDAPFYGFWFDYTGSTSNPFYQHRANSGSGGNITQNTNSSYLVGYYNETNLSDGTFGWIQDTPIGSATGTTSTTYGYNYSNLNPGKPDWATWIPMAGIYNGSMDHFGRAGLTDRIGGQATTPYLPASSLQVTSVLWANSPTSTGSSSTEGSAGNYPAGLLLHGTEGAYAPHYTTTSGTGPNQTTTTTTYQYSPGEYETRTSVNANTVATEGEGYWTTATTGYSTTASGWWTGSVDYGKESMATTIGQGQWNGENDITTYESWSDENGESGSGRHFHSYADTDVSTLANPSYAASIRCIRDKEAIVHQDDVLYYQDAEGNWVAYDGTDLVLYYWSEGSTTTSNSKDVINLYLTYVEEWKVTYPGAKWISINPTSGSTTDPSGAGSAIEITYTDNEQYAPTVNDTAIITITTARGTEFTITVVYVGGTRGQN